jgi:hypothetical protein
LSKSEKNLLGYISLRGPDLEAVYEYIRANKSADFESLISIFAMPGIKDEGPQKSQVQDCLKFLATVGLVQVQKAQKKELYQLAGSDEKTPFKTKLLHRLKLITSNPFHVLHSLLVSNDFLQIEKEVLVQEAERSLKSDFSWNIEKVDLWCRLARYLDLGNERSDTGMFVCYPAPNLIKRLLEMLSSQKTGRVRLWEFAQYISTNFFQVYTRKDKLFTGLQGTLQLMQTNGTITLFPAKSDDPRVAYVGEKPFGEVALGGK